MTNFAELAAPLVAQGYPVFPCWEVANGKIQADGTRKNPEGKNPRTAHGFKDATKDPKQIAAWAAEWPDALVGVPTGKASGLFVLDVDVKNGKDGFATLQAKGWALPDTRTHRTKNGGGAHYLFRNPEGKPLKCSASKLGAGLDIRTDGGYIVWWAAHGGEVEHADTVADVPPYLLDALQEPATRKPATAGDATDGKLTEGGRNDTLTRLAGKLRRAGLDAVAIEAALQIENKTKCEPSLSLAEVAGIARSIGKYQPGDEPPADADDEARIVWLAQLPALDYDRAREAAAEAMGVRVSTLDKQVRKLQGEAITDDDPLGDLTPWAHPVDGAALLGEIADTVRKFIVCDVETARAAALWAALTWFIDAVDVAPLAVITAPEKRCGKTQMLSVLGKLVRRPMSASNISAAALFRSIDAWHPTLLVDEADAFMRDNEELRGLLNSGHTRDSAYVVRVVGDDHTPTRFTTWGCKAIAGIGHLADTLMDRAIVLALRRKLAHESTERLRHAESGLFDDLAAKLARFAQDNTEAVRRARPALPSALNDRAQDNWEPLLSIAEIAGGDWPTLARDAALILSGGEPESTVGDELLADIREIFDGRQESKISTADLLAVLCFDAEKPWATYSRGRPLSHHQLARKLKGYGIRSKNVRIGHDVAKGYERGWFEDAFARYLSPLIPPAETATPLQPSNHAGFGVAVCKSVALHQTQTATREAAPALDCSGVAVCGGGAGEAYTEDEAYGLV
jgi:hypothetical protein